MTCGRCGSELPVRGPGVPGRTRRYCNVRCKASAKRRRQRHFRVEAPLGVAASTAGAIGEMMVAADLLRRGLSVYRAVNPDSACDLIVMVGPEAVRVEVTKGYRQTPGSKLRERTGHAADRYDVLAVWSPDGTIRYRPELDHLAALRQAAVS